MDTSISYSHSKLQKLMREYQVICYMYCIPDMRLQNAQLQQKYEHLQMYFSVANKGEFVALGP